MTPVTSQTRWEGVSDEDLLASFVAGRDREAAFGELVDRFERRVYAICYRYFGNHADAQDAAQDTFLLIARRAGTFQGDSKLSTWIYRVAVNACNDLARKRKRRPQTPVEDVAVVAGAAGLDVDEVDTASATETAIVVQKALLELDDLSRSLLIMVAMEGLSYQEAADALDIPVGTAKSRVHRARATLADLLETTVDPRGPLRRSDERGGNPTGPAGLLPSDDTVEERRGRG